jgi:putative spermidine/putrescine transport system permease protein
VIVIPASLNESRFITFPPDAISFRWYDELVNDPVWRDSFERSVIAGVISALVATPVGTLAAVSLVRGRYRGKSLLRLFFLAPLLVPLIVLSVGMFDLYSDLQLIGSPFALGLAHSVLALPFVVLVMSAAVQNFQDELEDAARTLGADRWQTFWRVTFPGIRNGIFASAVIAFITSFDEVVIAIFLSSGGETLPVTMYTFLKTQITPVIAAVSTILTIAVVVGFGVVRLVERRRRRLETTELLVQAAEEEERELVTL